MTPTTLAEALHLAMGDLRSMYPSPGAAQRQAAALLALPPDDRAEIAAELLDVELVGRTLETFITGHPAESDRHVEIGTRFLAALLEK